MAQLWGEHLFSTPLPLQHLLLQDHTADRAARDLSQPEITETCNHSQ